MTAPRPIVKKFTFQPGSGADTPENLYPRSDGRWGSFQNAYAVWPTTDNQVASFTIKRTFTATYTGTYYFRSTVDNSASIYIDDVLIGGTANFNQTPARVAKTLTAGDHVLKFVVSNGGDVAGIAVTISNSSDTLIWDTRTYASVTPDPDVGRYTLTMPFDGSVTMHLWGGGGGGGSGDKGGPGGNGSPGLYNTHTVNFSKDDVFEVAIGSGGQPGISGRPQIGGAGGKSRINIDSQSSKSFNGGTGGNGPVSGAGGGGGGATAILIDGQVVAVAGGGGGGGGAGNRSTGNHASIENNAMIQTGAITVQSSNWDATKDPKTTYIDVNGDHVIYGFTRGHTLAVFNPVTLALESKATYGGYDATSSTALKNALIAVPNGKIVAIGSFDVCALDQATRDLLNSQFGGTRTDTWRLTSPRVAHVFIGTKNGNIAAVENIVQGHLIAISRDAQRGPPGIIAGTLNAGTTVPTDYRGENGQSRGDDGGTGGAGGGGYPGGEGGKCNPGDSGANAGQTGGNLPASAAQTGTNSQYYVSNVASGGTNNNKGNPGYAVLVFTAEADTVAVSAVKVAGTWRQVTAAYVKVSGTWRTITNSYIKRNGVWYPIRSTGDKTLTEFTEQTTNYGSVVRTHS
jgi:hypothetical protein